MFHHMGEMATESGTQAIDRAAELLVSVVESSRPLGVGELAASSGLPKSTTSRLVGALERRGLVQRAGDRRVAPGPGAAALRPPGPVGEPRRAGAARAAHTRRAVRRDDQPRRPDAARRRAPRAGGLPPLHRRDELGRAPRPVRLDRERQGAEGVHLAHRRRQLRSASAVTRRRSTSSSRGSPRSPLPIFGPDGDVVAALSISGPTIRLTRERMLELAPHLITQAAQVSERLGHHDKRGAA